MQSDIRAVGQLVLLMMKHTDLKGLPSGVTEKLTSFVKACSFDLKNWLSVANHAFFEEQQLVEPSLTEDLPH